MKNETLAIHTILSDELTGAISTPIYQTSTFVQESPGTNKGYDYSRSNNPTRNALEQAIAKLEYGNAGFAFGSGLAAVDAILKLLSSGDEIIAVEDIYGGSFRLFEHIYKKLGITVHYVDACKVENVKNAINIKTKLIWLESPTNPTLKIADIKAIASIEKADDCYLVVDNTFASPVLQNPIKLGADIVLHSATKYLAGHSDVIAGLVVTATSYLSEKIKFIQNSTGAILGPFDSWLTLRGIQTLHLRVKKQCENAFHAALFLAQSEFVDKVYYPGLQNHPNYTIAKKQQNGLYGGIISFSLKEDYEENAIKFITSTKLFKLAESLGGVKSLVCHPATMTHKSTPKKHRHHVGINDSLIRLSFGIEDSQDLIKDLKQALDITIKTKLEPVVL
jgi:cystathionine beta-lyase